MPAMTGQFFFTTVAALALSTAGFVSLVTALRRQGHWSKTALWRLRGIVGESLLITLVAMLPLPIYYSVGGDERLTFRIMSGVIAIKLAFAIVTSVRERAEWGTRYTAQVVVLVGLQLAAQVANLALASLPLLMFGLLLWFSYPVQLLLTVIQDFQPPVDGD
jgi:hypothetical protein